MIIKIVILFLIVMGALGVFGRMRLPRLGITQKKCRTCGKPKIGSGPCSCGKDA